MDIIDELFNLPKRIAPYKTAAAKRSVFDTLGTLSQMNSLTSLWFLCNCKKYPLGLGSWVILLEIR